MSALPEFPRRWKLIALTIATGLIPAAILAALWSINTSSVRTAAIVFVSLMLPPAFIAALLLRRPTWAALGLVQGYALAALFAVGTLAVVWSGLREAFPEIWPFVLGVAIIATVPYIALFVAAWRTGRESLGEERVAPALAGVLGVWLLYPIAAGMGFWFDASVEIPGAWRSSAFGTLEKQVQPLVYQVEACAIRHAVADPPSGYPRTLEEMGPSGDDCLSGSAASGQPGGVRLEYTPAEPDSTGRVPSFLVRASMTMADGTMLSALGDTSGLVRVAMRRRADQSGAPTDTDHRPHERSQDVVTTIGLIRNCALHANAVRGDTSTPPATLDEIASPVVRQRVAGSPFCDAMRMGFIAERAGRKGVESRDGYRVTYVVPENPRNATDFIVEARPIRYGRNAVRSYLLRGAEQLHVTNADRPATELDPSVPTCQWGVYWAAVSPEPFCAVLPSTRAPAITVVHDSIVTAADTLHVSVTTPDVSTQSDSAYRFAIHCSAEPAPRFVPTAYQPGPDLWCGVPSSAAVPVPAMVHVAVFVQDRTGTLGRADSQVRVWPTSPDPSDD